jgi:hypothetical protein
MNMKKNEPQSLEKKAFIKFLPSCHFCGSLIYLFIHSFIHSFPFYYHTIVLGVHCNILKSSNNTSKLNSTTLPFLSLKLTTTSGDTVLTCSIYQKPSKFSFSIIKDSNPTAYRCILILIYWFFKHSKPIQTN